MYVVLVTDFASVNEVFGPFLSEAEARRWAELALRDNVYRVFPMKLPEEPPSVVEQRAD